MLAPKQSRDALNAAISDWMRKIADEFIAEQREIRARKPQRRFPRNDTDFDHERYRDEEGRAR